MTRETEKKRLGLIVNPLAGIGGKVGLKGSDGDETVRQAFALGAEIVAPSRAKETLLGLSAVKAEFDLITYPAEMGADEALACGYRPIVLGSIQPGKTTAEDTKRAAAELRDYGIDLIVFVGGDGTARDIYEAIGTSVPVLGVPGGVKIHSSVYAVNPKRAVALIEAFLQDRTSLRELEVMDIDEDLFREGRVSARLYGFLRVPFQRQLIQGAKIASSGSQDNAIGIAEYIVENMADNWYYVLGPGTTVKAIGDRLGIAKTLLGVDVVTQGQLIAKDVNEQQLLATIYDKNAKIIVTAIGGQGFVFGRGNQQISAQVIRQVGKENLIVVATKSKLLALDGPLLVDTGDPECDAYLSGYLTVITSYKQMSVWKVQA